MKNIIITWVGLVLLVAGGCMVIDTPVGYVEMDNPGDRLVSAVSAEDSRFSLRLVPNEGDGSLSFWQEAIKNHLERKRGYTLVTNREVTTGAGKKGRELLFHTASKGVEYHYLVAIYPYRNLFTGAWLQIAEAGGERACLEKDLPHIRQALTTLR